MSEPWIAIDDFKPGRGWTGSNQRAYTCCQDLERGQILFFRDLPFNLPPEDRQFLLSQSWTELRLHKNISYRPDEDTLRGVTGDRDTVDRLHSIMRNYTAQVIDFATKSLAPYADKWKLDFSSFRPLEEERRGLPLHKRNDLLHVDAFPSRPTRGGRILRVFTNLNPTKPRVWNVMQDFEALARYYAKDAGLDKFAEESLITRAVQDWGGKLGFRGMGRTPYDMFMLRFHDYLKENSEFQENCPKVRLEFPPLATWLVYTDGVAHAAMSGQFALEQTFLIPPSALVAKDQAPYRILERLAGRPLVS
jgi:3-deoxy-D-manno-oct-2-ulosonic acid (Kdo) hydroxylase